MEECTSCNSPEHPATRLRDQLAVKYQLQGLCQHLLNSYKGLGSRRPSDPQPYNQQLANQCFQGATPERRLRCIPIILNLLYQRVGRLSM